MRIEANASTFNQISISIWNDASCYVCTTQLVDLFAMNGLAREYLYGFANGALQEGRRFLTEMSEYFSSADSVRAIGINLMVRNKVLHFCLRLFTV